MVLVATEKTCEGYQNEKVDMGEAKKSSACKEREKKKIFSLA